MRGTVDRTNYLTYGLTDNEIPVLLASGYFFRISKEGTNAIIFDSKPQKTSNYFRSCLGRKYRKTFERNVLFDR